MHSDESIAQFMDRGLPHESLHTIDTVTLDDEAQSGPAGNHEGLVQAVQQHATRFLPSNSVKQLGQVAGPFLFLPQGPSSTVHGLEGPIDPDALPDFQSTIICELRTLARTL